MAALDFPRRHLSALHELALRLIDSRRPKTDNEPLARDLLAGFFDICMRAGLDRVLADLEQAHPGAATDRPAFYDHPTLLPALVKQLATIDLDGGGPRNAKPRLLAECVIAALGLTLSDEDTRPIDLASTLRGDVMGAITSAVHAELAVPRIRETIVARARELCEPRYHAAFDKIAAQLDERGQRMEKQPKVPLDASQAVQRVLTDARYALINEVTRAAMDRAKEVIKRVSPEAAVRIDRPISLRLTPRDVAVTRAVDPRIPKTPGSIAESVLESLTELAQIVWRVPERAARTYSPRETFAVGDLIEHPKFGRGSVTSCAAQRIDVEFEDGTHTLVHVRAAK